MNRLEGAIREISMLEEEANGVSWIHGVHPLSKLVLTVWFVILVVSFQRYNVTGLLSMGLYPLAVFLVFDISIQRCFRRLWVVLPVVLAIGIVNPLIDREIITNVGGVAVSGGMISMMTMMIKSIFSVLAVYLMVVTTGMDRLCAALTALWIPRAAAVVILLMYRYLSVLLTQANRMTQAYLLRSPNRKGIHLSAWGSFMGLLLLQSIDRAQDVYESMCLRGFGGPNGNGYGIHAEPDSMRPGSMLWVLGWGAAMVFLRAVPLFEIIGEMM